MTKKKSEQQLIVQALNAAETNIKLAKQLLSGVRDQPPKPSTRELPGITGTFDGEDMVTEEGKKYPVNPNYASKSVLVYGDTLKKIEEDGQERFKQIARVKRQKVEGILAKKDGKFVAVTADGSYKVSPVAVGFYGGKEGDEVVVVLPLEDKNAPFAALESIKKEETQRTQKKTEDTEKEPSMPSEPSVPSVIKKAIKRRTTKKEPVIKKPVTRKARKKTEDTEKEEEKPKAKPAPEPRPKDDRPLAGVENDEELR